MARQPNPGGGNPRPDPEQGRTKDATRTSSARPHRTQPRQARDPAGARTTRTGKSLISREIRGMPAHAKPRPGKRAGPARQRHGRAPDHEKAHDQGHGPGGRGRKPTPSGRPGQATPTTRPGAQPRNASRHQARQRPRTGPRQAGARNPRRAPARARSKHRARRAKGGGRSTTQRGRQANRSAENQQRHGMTRPHVDVVPAMHHTGDG